MLTPFYILKERTNTAQADATWCVTQKYGIFHFSKIAKIDKNTDITLYLASLTKF